MSGIKRITEPDFRHWRDRGRVCLFLMLVLISSRAPADDLTIKVHGLKDPLLSEVNHRLETHRVSVKSRLSTRRLQQRANKAELEAEEAMRPFGYYHPEISSTLSQQGEETWLLDLHIIPGPPVIISSATVEITGDGAELAELDRWKDDWPLKAGKVLDQTVWESQKQAAMELAEAAGYLSARFTQHAIEADLINNQATTTLVLETGPQAVVGTVIFNQDAVRPGVLELLPRFSEGQTYDSWLLEKFRLDMWHTGYFNDVEIVEERRLEESPPKVNFVVNARARKPNTYQGSIGYGTDTEVRTQVLWTRHILSTRGDSLDTGLGWQQRNNEYSFKSNYRLPRRVKARQFWIADLFVTREDQDFKVSANDNSPDFFKLTTGNVVDYSVKAGRLTVRDRQRGYEQIFETWYGQYVIEDSTFSLNDLILGEPESALLDAELNQFRHTNSSFALGINWDWPVVRGNGFSTHGHHERAWIFTANNAWGSDREFTQAYLSSNWTRMIKPNLKVLLRGEVGYTDTNTWSRSVDTGEQVVNLSVTDLPSLYRFKTGGSRAVRGYAFESLSNNGIGSGNIVTGSVEVDWLFREKWSAAAFFDVGNAFNDWGQANLKKGAGVGIRWYSIVGPIRLDFAQALSYDGHPWTVHFTIGTPLL